MSKTMDINCDIGEGFGIYSLGNDEFILPWVTSANIACGFHAGDPTLMHKTIKQCIQHGTAIGAHPGLPDRVGFGRRAMDLSATEVYDIILYQIGALAAMTRAEGASLRHVKPHGALYHMAESDATMASTIVRAVADYDKSITIVGMSGGRLVDAAEQLGLNALHEVFADRVYLPNGTLASRKQPYALISDPEQAAQQALDLATDGTVNTTHSERIRLRVDTICIHGDQPNAPKIAKRIHQKLTKANISLKH